MEPLTNTEALTLFQVAPYQLPWGGGWSEGKIHLVNSDEQKTFCGAKLVFLEGENIQGAERHITCKGCLRCLASKREREQEDRESKERAAEYEAEKEVASARWWHAYNAYLQSPAWKSKRQLVMQRAGGVCEGCRRNKATEVHHLVYPGGWKREILAGSDEWARAEKLFHLVAICTDCHADIHGK